MFPRHCAHFLLPLFSLPPPFSSIYGSAEMQWVTFQKKSPYHWSVGMCVWAAWPISTARWMRQGSKGVKCKSNCECLADRQLELHHCQQQREMWSSLFFHSPSTVALTRTEALIYVIPAATISAVSKYEMNPDLKKAFRYKCLHPYLEKTSLLLQTSRSQSVILFYMF